jgi:hypothetical protein
MRPVSTRIAGVAFVASLIAAPAFAQTIVGPVQAGACHVMVRLSPPVAPGTEVVLEINKNAVAPVAAGGKTEVRIPGAGFFAGPLSEGEELRARLRVPGSAAPLGPGVAILVASGAGPAECAAPAEADVIVSDERDTFESSGYVGMAVDNFAPASVGGYADPQAGGKQTRVVGGFDFDFRVLGAPTSRRQLWVYGETVHGVRSADVNCAPDNTDRPAVCEKLTQANAGRQLQFVLENATSMEAFGGLRYEFLTLQADSGSPAKLYLTVRTGVMMVNGRIRVGDEGAPVLSGTHAYRAHHVGGGLLMPAGKFAGSVLEVGWGRTDIFDNERIKEHWRRLKIDASLNVKMVGPMYGFVQLYSDFDPTGRASDSVQTFFGLSFSIPEFFR